MEKSLKDKKKSFPDFFKHNLQLKKFPTLFQISANQSFRIEISKEGELRAVEKSCKYSHMIEVSHDFSEEVK